DVCALVDGAEQFDQERAGRREVGFEHCAVALRQFSGRDQPLDAAPIGHEEGFGGGEFWGRSLVCHRSDSLASTTPVPTRETTFARATCATGGSSLVRHGWFFSRRRGGTSFGHRAEELTRGRCPTSSTGRSGT